MEVFSLVVACVLVLAFTTFILITLYTIIRDLLRKKNRKNAVSNNQNDSREEVK